MTGSEDAQSVPGFPQDMWMPMDEMVADKPEVFGLRKDWTGSMMGMMTLVRVLPPELYDKIMDMKKRQSGQQAMGNPNKLGSREG